MPEEYLWVINPEGRKVEIPKILYQLPENTKNI
jgi:hypothetical protein